MTPTVPYVGPTTEDLARIPAELKARRQWVLWRGEDRVDQQTGEIRLNKVPVNPQTLRNADTTDPQTWGTFEECVAALPTALEEWEHDNPSAYRGGGIGLSLLQMTRISASTWITAATHDTGSIAAWAQEYLTALDSYTEVSPSGTGLHIFIQGLLPPKGRKKGPS